MLATLGWGAANFLIWRLPEQAGSLRSLTKLVNLGWFTLLVFGATGMFQMSEHPLYAGFLDVQTRWASALLIKHGVILGCLAVYAWLSLGALPSLRRQELTGIDKPGEGTLRRVRWAGLLTLLLTVVILALTAVARTA